MDIIRMYFDMKRDEAELQAAFAHFKQCENVKSWHWKFHDNDELHSRGVVCDADLESGHAGFCARSWSW